MTTTSIICLHYSQVRDRSKLERKLLRYKAGFFLLLTHLLVTYHPPSNTLLVNIPTGIQSRPYCTMEDSANLEVLKSNIPKCLVCKSGDILPQKRSDDKDGFVIYGRNGMRNAIHVESRCNFKNEHFHCNAGYFHGYMSYKGRKIVHDDILKEKVLVTSN